MQAHKLTLGRQDKITAHDDAQLHALTRESLVGCNCRKHSLIKSSEIRVYYLENMTFRSMWTNSNCLINMKGERKECTRRGGEEERHPECKKALRGEGT